VVTRRGFSGERNMTVGEGLPEDQVKILKNHRWDRNFYA
jgi:hypothetical protein